MSLKYIRSTYAVPAKRGALVECKVNGYWVKGKISGGDHRVIVKTEESPYRKMRFHPTDSENLRYL